MNALFFLTFPAKMESFDGRLALDRVGLEPQAGTGEQSPPGLVAKLRASPFHGNYNPDLAYRTLPWSIELLLEHSRKSLVMRRRQNPDHLPIPPPLQVVLAATSRLAGRARC